MRVCLDTNVFIAVMNREEDCEYCEAIMDAIDDGRIEGIVQTLVITEVLVGYYKNKEYKLADRFLACIARSYGIIPLDIKISKLSAKLRAEYGVKLPDAIVVATAINFADRLITKDETLLHKFPNKVNTPKDFVERFLNF